MHRTVPACRDEPAVAVAGRLAGQLAGMGLIVRKSARERYPEFAEQPFSHRPAGYGLAGTGTRVHDDEPFGLGFAHGNNVVLYWHKNSKLAAEVE